MISSVKKVSLTAFITALLLLSFSAINAQCFEIESILVDACGSPEGENEMVRFKIGSTALNTSNITLNWPNNSWLGLSQNAGTATTTSALNNTVTGCGLLIEPTAGALPANSKVLLITSTALNTTANSFANLNDTLYIIYQNAGNPFGHFVNYNTTPGLRTLIISFSVPINCNDTVTYDRTLLVNQNGTPGGSAALKNGASVNFSPNGIPTYFNNGCQAPVTPILLTAANLTPLSICPGDSVNLTATYSSGIQSILWAEGTGSFLTPNNFNSTYYSLPTDATPYFIKLNGITACNDTVKDSLQITFIAPSNPTITEADTVDICIGSNITLHATGASSYLWSNSLTTAAITVSMPGDYFVTSNNISCPSDTDSVHVNIIPNYTVTISGPDTVNICQGSDTSLYANGASSYLWSTLANTDSIIVNTSGLYYTFANTICPSDTDFVYVNVVPNLTVNINEPSIISLCDGETITLTTTGTGPFLWNNGSTFDSLIVTTAGNYTVTSSNTCSSANATVQVNINPPINVTISGPDTVDICQGINTTLTANGAISYLWNTFSNTNSISVNTSGLYYVFSNTTCPSDTDSVYVNVIPNLTVSINEPSIINLCTGETITLTTTGTGPFLWNNGSTFDSLVVTTAGNYAVTSSNTCSSANAAVQVNINPSITVNILEPDTFICDGESLILHANGTSSYIWSTGETTPNITVTTSGFYTLTANTSCPSNTASIQVAVIPKSSPLIAEGDSLVLCPNTSIVLHATGGNSYVWNTSETTNSIQLNSTGTYFVRSTNGNCPGGYDTIVIMNDIIPSAQIIGDSIFCTGESTILNALGSGNFSWSTGTTGDHLLVRFEEEIILTAENSCGILASDSILIIKEDCNLTTKVYIPNAFTPNGNGRNELFKVMGTNILSINGKIYNRWGELVFEWNDINDGWDGTFRNEPASSGVYIYKITVEDSNYDDNVKSYVNFIVLVR
tara:strand:- start:1058 stop:3949 length:2892 start_codon:yes stop_codon:yes gene_type:complete